jgi:hypothetical protein
MQGAAGGCCSVATLSRPPRQEEGRNMPDQTEEGAAVMAGDVGTTVVGSGGKSAGWLRRSGLAKVQHHGRSLV